jgi:hypothetical protein
VVNEMKKIGICIMHDWYVTSWFDTNIVQEVALKNDVFIFASEEIISKCKEKASNYNNVKLIEVQFPVAKLISRAYYFISMIIKRKINSSFRIRLKYLVFGELKFFPSPFNLRNSYICFSSNCRQFLNYSRRYFYQLPAYIPLLDQVLFKSLRFIYNRSAFDLPKSLREDFDLLIFVGGNIEVGMFEMIKELREFGTTTALCIENWDNLTSKRFMISVPDYVFVMGEDSARLASLVQGIDKSRIVVAGLPRFNPYRKMDKTVIGGQRKVFTILYLGFYQPHNEIKLLNLLVEKLDKSTLLGKYEIIYKPHPGPRARSLDDRVLHPLISVIKSKTRVPPIINAEHTLIMQSADIVVSTPTSMVIECMILGKKVVLDLTNDGVNRSTTNLAYKNYIHFRILDEIDNLDKCFSIDELREKIEYEFLSPSVGYINYNLGQLIENNQQSYSHHILSILD